MQFCFIRDSVSLVMPVTPGNYQWSVGKNMETINISQLGDVYRPGRTEPVLRAASSSSSLLRNIPGWRHRPDRILSIISTI